MKDKMDINPSARSDDHDKKQSAVVVVSAMSSAAEPTETNGKNQDSYEEVALNFTLYNQYVRHSTRFIQRSDITKGAKGFLDILSKHKKLPWGQKVRIAYKIGLFIYYLVNFLYPLIVFAIEGQHPAYNIVCGLISLIGILIEAGKVIIPYSYHKIKQWNVNRHRSCQVSPTNIMPADNESMAIEDYENDT